MDYNKSWKVVTIAVKIIDRALREDFGFKDILWVFSGRRGVHVWVADERAFNLETSGRNAIIGYFSPLSKMRHPFSSMFDHPVSINDDDLISQTFHEILTDQKMMDINTIDKTLSVMNEDLSSIDVKKVVNSYPTQKARWEAIENILLNNDEDHFTNKESLPLQRNKTMRMRKDARHTLMHIRFDNFYPRIDTNVSFSAAHLLKVVEAQMITSQTWTLFDYSITVLFIFLTFTTSLAIVMLVLMFICTLHLLIVKS